MGSLEASWGVLDRLGSSWHRLGPIWGPLGRVLGVSWARFVPLLGRLGGILGASWAPLGPFLRPGGPEGAGNQFFESLLSPFLH